MLNKYVPQMTLAILIVGVVILLVVLGWREEKKTDETTNTDYVQKSFFNYPVMKSKAA